MARAFGIPYARQQVMSYGVVAVCPECGERVPLLERKDSESFTGNEYAAHYALEHAVLDRPSMGPDLNDDPEREDWLG